MVIESHPRLDDGSAFPTLYWLTCPILAKRVSALEGAGGMRVVNSDLQRDAALRSRLQSALGSYKERRDRHEPIDDSGAPPGGGPDRVKCLHSHVAHELSDPPNPIGSRALAEVGFPDCRVSCYSVT